MKEKPKIKQANVKPCTQKWIKKRAQIKKRKDAHSDIDLKKDQTPKRKNMHSDIDSTRDKTPKRRQMHR